jgi:hypothetical protein
MGAAFALWATLRVFVIYFIVFIIPKMPEIRAQNERVRVQEISNEGRTTNLRSERVLAIRPADHFTAFVASSDSG